MSVPSRCLPRSNVKVIAFDANGEGWDWLFGWLPGNLAGSDVETALVDWALDLIAVKLAFPQHAEGVRAQPTNSVVLVSEANQHDTLAGGGGQ